MAKDQQKRRQTKTSRKKTEKKGFIPERYLDAVYIGIIVLSAFIFLWPAISGGGFAVFDNIASFSFDNYLKDADNEGVFPLWIPYIFSGMPSYASMLLTGDRYWDIFPEIFFGFTALFRDIFNNDAARMACFYAIYGVGMYLFMRFKKHERFVSAFTAFAAMFSTWVITWVMIGHNTKPVVLAMLPFIFLFLEKLRIKFSLLNAVFLIIAVHIMIEAGHLQMIFYSILALGIYLIYELIYTLTRKEKVTGVLRSALLLILAGGMAFIMSADRYFATMEYTSYSTRGSAPIQQVSDEKVTESGGHGYDYATMWSYSGDELFTMLVPSYFGFGHRKYDGQSLSTYWGQKESEDSPPYMGILIIGLALIGFIAFRHKPFVQFLFVLSAIATLLSFGKNMPLLYDLFYYNIPSFNKFRAPSMSLVLVHFAMPILAGYGITSLIAWRREFTDLAKKWMYAIMILAGIFLLSGFIFSAAFEESYIESLSASDYFQRLAQMYGAGTLQGLRDFVFDNAVSDWLTNGFLALIAAVSAFLFVKNRITKVTFFALIGIILVFDLWRVDYRRMDVSEENVTKAAFGRYENLYGVIKQDKDLFRVADFVAYPSNVTAYYLLENINGYHAAKLRVYQDILDNANPDQYAGSTAHLYNPFLWNMLNVRYIILNQQLGQGMQAVYQDPSLNAFVYLNPGELPRAFFVNSVEVAKPLDILSHLKNGDFDPQELAYVENEIPENIEPVTPGATAKVVEHKNQYIKIDVNATGNNLLFVGEVYYPPSWEAYIDGKKAEIYKTNYAFRSVIVPKGKHTVEFKYQSDSFQTGRLFSIITNIIVVAALIGGVYLNRRKKNVEPKE